MTSLSAPYLYTLWTSRTTLTFKAKRRSQSLDLVIGTVIQDVNSDVGVIQVLHVLPGVRKQNRGLVAYRQKHVDRWGVAFNDAASSNDLLVFLEVEISSPNRHTEICRELSPNTK